VQEPVSQQEPLETGRVPQRTWDENDGGEAPTKLLYPVRGSLPLE
jgi:hypothetical protein